MRLVAHLRRSLLAGLLIILPLVVTFWLFALILRPVQKFVTRRLSVTEKHTEVVFAVDYTAVDHAAEAAAR